MKNTSQTTEVVYVPLELLTEVRKIADEERRGIDELIADAVRSYLDHRRQPDTVASQDLAQLLADSPLAGANLDLERRKDYTHPYKL